VVRTLALVMLLLPLAASAAEITCKKSPALTGQCRMVKGSLGLTPSLGVTLMPEDGTRIIIKAPPDSNADIAVPVMQNWLYWQTKTGSMKTRINGTFELCPLPPQPNAAGIKDFGCINKGSRITQDLAPDQ
jgi:hypothetical protein